MYYSQLIECRLDADVSDALFFFFFFKQKTAYEISACLVGSEMCIRDSKGIADAKKNMVKVTLEGTTIPHEVIGVFGAGRVMLKPAPEGTGIIAGGAVRAVMEAAGISNIRAKCLRSNNPQNVVKATMQGLMSLRDAAAVARIRGKSVEEIVG